MDGAVSFGPDCGPLQEVHEMSDGDDWRRARRSRSRRGGGGEDDFAQDGGGASAPPPSYGAPASSGSRQSFAAASGPEVGAVVNRFDPERGFGFVALDGGGDAFLHISALQRAGKDTVSSGTRLRVRVGQGQKGQQVTEVLEVGEAGPAPQRRGGAPAAVESPGVPVEVRGVVKWYSAEKGFGFVTPEDGGRDVFVHATALERSGMTPLAEGQAVTLRVVQGRKGPEAEAVSA
jgi:CspA family cold shock protein